MNVLIWLLDRWDAYCRRYDIEVLWPACKKAAEYNMTEARAAFVAHALVDPAWRRIGAGPAIQQIMDLD